MGQAEMRKQRLGAEYGKGVMLDLLTPFRPFVDKTGVAGFLIRWNADGYPLGSLVAVDITPEGWSIKNIDPPSDFDGKAICYAIGLAYHNGVLGDGNKPNIWQNERGVIVVLSTGEKAEVGATFGVAPSNQVEHTTVSNTIVNLLGSTAVTHCAVCKQSFTERPAPHTDCMEFHEITAEAKVVN